MKFTQLKLALLDHVLLEVGELTSARTWPIFFYRYIVPYDDRLSIKNNNLVT